MNWPKIIYIHRQGGGFDEPAIEEVELVADEPDKEYEGYVADGHHRKYLDAETCVPKPVMEQIIESKDMRIADLEGALQRILDWANAYPETVFIPIKDEEWPGIHEKVGKELLSRISGHNMRHVITGVRGICTDALKEDEAS